MSNQCKQGHSRGMRTRYEVSSLVDKISYRQIGRLQLGLVQRFERITTVRVADEGMGSKCQRNMFICVDYT